MSELVDEISQELIELKMIHNWQAEEVIKYIASRVRSMDLTFAMYVFDRLDLETCDIQAAAFNLSPEWLTHQGLRKLWMTRPQRERYYAWLDEKRGVQSEPETVEVSQTLHELESQITDERERMFYLETKHCLEAKAFRAAIVMGWNLAYQHLLEWVFRDPDRLSAFNDDLTERWVNKRKGVKFAEVIEHEDFGNVKESMIIEVCKACSLITQKDLEALQSGLRKRNKFAHPSSTSAADGPIASGHVSELVQIMLSLR